MMAKKNKPKKSKLKVAVYVIFWATMIMSILGAGAAIALYFHMAKDLPPLTSLRNYRPALSTEVYADDGTLIAEFYPVEEYDGRRKLVPMHEIPDVMKESIVAMEDRRFFQHPGVDFPGITRAVVYYLLGKTDQIEATSTITMQVARTFFLTPERTMERKIKEAILSIRIGRYLTKEEILFLYLNQIHFGRNNYGIGSASQYYFGKEAKDLELHEAAILAGMPPAPNSLNPVYDFEAAKRKQKIVLRVMVEQGLITQEEADEAAAKPLSIAWNRPPGGDLAPHFTEHVRRLLIERYGSETVLKGGLKVFTTVNLERDKLSRDVVKKHILGHRGADKALGYRGPLPGGPLFGSSAEKFHEKIEEERTMDWFYEKKEEILVEPSLDKPSDAEIKKTAPSPMPLKKGERYKAVVTEIDDRIFEVWVRTGESSGRINKKHMEWARPWDRDGEAWQQDKFPWKALKKPSQILEKGDIIIVSVVEPEKDKDGNTRYLFSLEQRPEIQAGLLGMSVRNGHVKALAGGVSGQFIRPIQAKRQPGSAFKPIVYGLAIEEQKYTPASIVYDSPIIFERDTYNPDCPGDVLFWEEYMPKNYNDTFRGPQTVRQALANSINTIAVKVCWDMCLPKVINFARSIGVESHLDLLPCLALGCSETTVEELVQTYNVYASGGYLVKPIYITRIYDADGNLFGEYDKTISGSRVKNKGSVLPGGMVEEDIGSEAPMKGMEKAMHVRLNNPVPPQLRGEPTWEEYLEQIRSKDHDWLPPLKSHPLGDNKVFSPQAAYIMNSMLMSVTLEGTARDARRLDRPVAGKTGTTNRYRDAWFVGYTPEFIAGVWVGGDKYMPLGKGMSGGAAALPIWLDFMEVAVKDRRPYDFPVPPGVEWVEINEINGMLARDCTPKENRRVECFIKGTAPEQYDDCKTAAGEIPLHDNDPLRNMDTP